MEVRPILSAMLRAKTAPLLLAAQVALTLAIICNTSYLIVERLTASSRSAGVDEPNVFAIAFAPAQRIDDLLSMQLRDEETLRAIPGVVSATWTNQVPLGQSGWNNGGLSATPDNGDSRIGAGQYFNPGSLVDTLGLRLIEGRDFAAADVVTVDPEQGMEVGEQVIITRSLAQQLYPGESQYVGRRVYSGPDGDGQQVIGVVEKLHNPWAPTDDVAAEGSMLYPIRFLDGNSVYVVRTEPGRLQEVMRQAEAQLSALRNDRVLRWARSMSEIRDRRYAGERLLAGLLLGVTGFLLLITASGIVGMASLWVNQRRKQIGVRRALGARRIDILRYFLIENALISSLGVISGFVLALALNDLLVRELSVSRLPWQYLAAGMVSMWLLGLLAVLAPAMRAAAVPPAVATRTA
ncbi:ABC transporter permease [Pseudomarimonas arenosa]|uniref:FtsX-like permease family protein n=1 Tax=Pseudomarimonas arenosa TaxID=2774145 RepID=A0AAW3ZGF6_9GAMM|nr:FtsX-like permease family protein [Pseudomarimonas arenosa]MBD8525198.1 FtsX-like permease family protein [Pseudomarimonas arenosa]